MKKEKRNGKIKAVFAINDVSTECSDLPEFTEYCTEMKITLTLPRRITIIKYYAAFFGKTKTNKVTN